MCTERQKDSEPGEQAPVPPGLPVGPCRSYVCDVDMFPTKSVWQIRQGMDYRPRKAQVI